MVGAHRTSTIGEIVENYRCSLPSRHLHVSGKYTILCRIKSSPKSVWAIKYLYDSVGIVLDQEFFCSLFSHFRVGERSGHSNYYRIPFAGDKESVHYGKTFSTSS